ncbi:VWA domain-containing protein [Gordonia sp. (in: high G+C Gram-positive bacteria)]|uniref:VWA domain-containing protein n=1 Tax=Gordonia sp. (in: high G+C Gram-positive bacteria) TaxID=84139 RepID=UPI001698A38B|nr:VWA domain-containing protein [Gordonia sp. (in: high G+C Gram-positive bacteria)]NLG46567.1 VWA domain-containing protein [Gordonia sp. (in: high G+C Gram-positive bacteria)]
MSSQDEDRLTRWRLVLGGGDADGIDGENGGGIDLSKADAARDRVLGELYDGPRRGGLGGSQPRVARWLGDIRTYFPSSVVQVMQADAMDRLGLKQMLLEPELMAAVQPDVALVSTLITLNQVMDEQSRETARHVVRQVTDQLEERLRRATVQAVTGAVDRSSRTSRPRPADIDWNRTITANLKHYQPDYRTVIPERLVGYARRQSQVQRDIILCIDQSGSMAESVVFASVFGAVLASLRSVRTRLVVFDTEVVDLTDEMQDPVDILFGVQLGGGTDINRAVTYCQSLIERPENTVFVLISDLFEGGVAEELLDRSRSIVASGATMVSLLALSDSGTPAFDADLAAELTGLGVPSFACTPDLFPDLMAAAIEHRDVAEWASSRDIPVAVTD